MEHTIESICGYITNSELEEFEHGLTVKLPEDYRIFLLSYNAAKPKPAAYFINEQQGDNLVRDLLGLCDKDWYSLRDHLEVYNGRIPSNFLPIATDYFSNLVCLSISGEDRGKVYFWDHDWEVVDGEPDYSNVHLIAESFTVFLESLYEATDV